ncbi:PQQ-dependent sugar dehydrogenase [Sphingopyxis sp. CCNWLW253]|uniref:PQQ-dependent sugar dehydrogenase n=1 Tax=unclassified Sphingopyxis TaxID=2614943 RepID=UPI0030130DBD
MGKKFHAAALSVLSGILLSSCGDGGGDPPVVIPPNQPPTLTSATSVSTVENATLAFQATATDPDGNTLTFSIGGTDATRFSITASGLLNFLSAPDFDNPADENGDNIYLIQISVSDGRTSVSQPLAVTVTNSREGIVVNRIFAGLEQTVTMSAIPGDSRLFVAEGDGSIYYFDPAARTRTLYTRVISKSGFRSAGLLNMAASPDYANDGLLYVSLQTPTETSVYALDRAKADPGSASNSIEVATFPQQVLPITQAGWLGFAPNGDLYYGRGAARYTNNDEGAHADDTYRGKLIRIRRNASPGAPSQYSYDLAAKGLFGPASGTFVGNTLLIGDTGLKVTGEIDRFDINGPVVSFGYPYREGNTAVFPPEPAGLIAPVLEIAFGAGLKQSGGIILGPVYNGPITSLRGQLIFADAQLLNGNSMGSIWTIDASQLLGATTTLPSAAYSLRKADFTPNSGGMSAVRSFAATADGKLFILDRGGSIYEVVAGS